MTPLRKEVVRKFQSTVYAHCRAHRRNLPWRGIRDPYCVLVSEVMLQQTPVARAARFFVRFIKKFPNLASLARAPQSDIVRVWQGLGYNRRALNLQRVARAIAREHNGKVPCDVKKLEALPGIGVYTASAVMAFAYNKPAAFVETNIRTVFLHHFFKGTRLVSDSEIIPLVRQVVDENSPRIWYQALMDYGAALKTIVGRTKARSRHYAKQSEFFGSRRELRGKLITLSLKAAITPKRLRAFCEEHNTRAKRAREVLRTLVSEGFLYSNGETYSLA